MKRNGLQIIQPVFFDINKNCAYDTSGDKKLTNDLASENFQKGKIYELTTQLLIQRFLSLLESYKSLFIGDKLKCVLLSPCYITNRPVTKKIIM